MVPSSGTMVGAFYSATDEGARASLGPMR